METVKFKGWNKNQKKIVDLQALTPLALDPNMNSILAIEGKGGLFIPFFPEIELIQFTGVKDQKGVEIYEGHIIDCKITTSSGSLIHRGEVVYVEHLASFATKNHSGETLFCHHLVNTREVIGNIYENPELLK